MGSRPPPSSSGWGNPRSMLILFAVIGLGGVLMFKFSVPLGLFLLVVAEVFFALAYRGFAKRAKSGS